MPRTSRALWLGLFLLAACDRGQDERAITPSDPWLRPPSVEVITSSKEIDRANFVLVTAQEAEAVARLKDAAWIELKPEEADEFAGQPIGGQGGKFVLLRAVSWDTPHGGFTLSWWPRAVRVTHGSLGRHPLPVIRRAIVARLPDLPTDVYVDLCMAE